MLIGINCPNLYWRDETTFFLFLCFDDGGGKRVSPKFLIGFQLD